MIAPELLAQAALGELDAAAEAAVEEHVVSCGACAARYAALVRVGPAIAALVRSGGSTFVATRTLVERLEAEGLVSRRYALAPGEIVPCSVGAEDLYALVTYEAELRGIERLDLLVFGQRSEDVPFDPASGRVFTLTSSAFLRTLPDMQVPLRLVAVAPDGSERTLGDYTLDHTAFRSPSPA